MLPVARQDNLLIQEVGDELVVYDQARDRAHSLNPTAARVWRHCDGQTTVAQLAALVALDLRIPADEDVVWLALDRLEKAHLLRGPVERPASARALTRREVVKRLGIAGALAVMLPAVKSIAAPTPAMAASPGGGVVCVGEFAPCTPAVCCPTGYACTQVVSQDMADQLNAMFGGPFMVGTSYCLPSAG